MLLANMFRKRRASFSNVEWKSVVSTSRYFCMMLSGTIDSNPTKYTFGVSSNTMGRISPRISQLSPINRLSTWRPVQTATATPADTTTRRAATPQ